MESFRLILGINDQSDELAMPIPEDQPEDGSGLMVIAVGAQ